MSADEIQTYIMDVHGMSATKAEAQAIARRLDFSPVWDQVDMIVYGLPHFGVDPSKETTDQPELF